MAPWNRRFLLETIIFRFHVKIGEGTLPEADMTSHLNIGQIPKRLFLYSKHPLLGAKMLVSGRAIS